MRIFTHSATAAGIIRSTGMFIGMNATSMFFSAFISGTHSVTPAKKIRLPPSVMT
jgi:hypothetical protein